MFFFNCVVHQGYVPEEIRSDLVTGLVRVSTSILGGSPDDVDVTFIEIPRGYGFTGGEPASKSAVRARIPDGCEVATRNRLMREITDMWCDIVGCSSDELGVSAADQSYNG